jgi:hypothetical protein
MSALLGNRRKSPQYGPRVFCEKGTSAPIRSLHQIMRDWARTIEDLSQLLTTIVPLFAAVLAVSFDLSDILHTLFGPLFERF